MAEMSMGDRFVMVGDSITDGGRERPVGRAPFGLGYGYPALVDAMLTAEYGDLNIAVINMGIGGDTSRDVSARWTRDVVDLKPNWVSLMIGVNDVWRKFDHPNAPELHVPLAEYRTLVENVVAGMLTQVKGFLLVSPFFLELDGSDPMRAMVDEYRQAMDAIAREYSLPFFDTQKMFDHWMAEHPALNLSPDRVHPGLFGHYLLAKNLVEEITEAGWL